MTHSANYHHHLRQIPLQLTFSQPDYYYYHDDGLVITNLTSSPPDGAGVVGGGGGADGVGGRGGGSSRFGGGGVDVSGSIMGGGGGGGGVGSGGSVGVGGGGDGGGGGNSGGGSFNLTSDESQMLLARIAEEYQNQTHWFLTETVAALVVSYCLVIALGLVGNGLVIVVMLRRKDLQTSRNFYILNLSVCDIFMSSVCMPFSLVKYVVKRWVLGAAMCRIVPALATVDVFVSTVTIIAIAADRYRAIVRSSTKSSRDHGNSSSAFKVTCSLLVIWLVSIGFAAPLFIFHELKTERVFGKLVFHTCIEVWPHDRFRETYSVVVALFQYLAPTAVISILHARICSFLRRRIRDSPTPESQVRRRERQMKRHRKNMMLLTTIAVTFSVAWLPLTVLNLTADWTHDNSIFGLFSEEQFYLAHAICLLIAMSSSAVNPLLYGWFNSNFRSAFLEILHFRNSSSAESSSLKGGQEGSGAEKKSGGRNYDSFIKTPSIHSHSSN